MAYVAKTAGGKYRVDYAIKGVRGNRTIEASGLREAHAIGRSWEKGEVTPPERGPRGTKSPPAQPPVVSSTPSPVADPVPKQPDPPPAATPVVGMPAAGAAGGAKVVSAETRAAIAGALGVKTPESKRKKKNETLCMMLGHLVGHLYTAAISWAMRQWGGREPAKPDPGQLKEYSDAWTEQLREWFVDVDLRPWHTICLVGFAMAAGMWMQGRAIVKVPTSDEVRRHLAAVPAPPAEPVT